MEIGEVKKAKELGIKGTNSYIWQTCEGCGRAKWIGLKNNRPRSLRCRGCANKIRSGENHPNWEGGRNKRPDGYIGILLRPDDFFYPMADHKGYVLEHRLIIAKRLGRNLHSWEIVHHIDHIRDHNEDNNLQLVSDDRHNQLTILETKMDRQTQLIEDLRKEIKLLHWQIKELSNAHSSDSRIL